MPIYEYRCPANGRSIEVTHGMSETLGTWGELCARGEVDPGTTPADSPVEWVVSLVSARSSGQSQGGGACGPSCGCHPH